MSRPVIVRLPARQDVQEIREYLKQHRASAAVKFDSRLVALLLRIASMPFMYAKIWRTVRAVRIRGFRFVLYYVVFRDRTEVIAVVHGARESSVWKSRV